MTYKVAILSSPLSQSQKDLYKMITHLGKTLSEVSGAEIESITLTPELQINYQKYDHVIFCGYDHLTLANVHMCLDQAKLPAITLYDEPGKSLESEIKNILFRGVDSGRIPVSSLSAIEYCWSYRDILSRISQFCRESEKSSPRPSTRSPRTRKVETTGEAQASKGASADQAGDS